MDNKKLKNKTILRVIPTLMLTSLLSVQTGCNSSKPKPKDRGNFKESSEDLYEATVNSLVSTDIYGRSFGESDVAQSDRTVGMFYFVWHGEHTSAIYDVTKAKADNPDELWKKGSAIYPMNQFYYFSEPLYGYYQSDDPWVLARHIELLTMSGIDYISLDLTNWSIYENNITVLLNSLLSFQQQGWKVPLVTSILNGTDPAADHPGRITRFYNIFYKNPKYDSLWYRDPITGKPSVTITINDYLSLLGEEVRENLSFRNTIWPYDKGQTEYNDASWMDWTYPQRIYLNEIGNYMSVSVAQHCGGAFGYSVNPKFDSSIFHDTNRGRGWDYEKNTNVAENAFKGTNLEQQWKNALDNKKDLDEVFVTGWNEWVAYKLPSEMFDAYLKQSQGTLVPSNEVTFCDTCDEEFSRDLEMTKGGYGDNFYLQNMRNTRAFKTAKPVSYYGSYHTSNLASKSWEGVRTYLDFANDAIARDFPATDNSFNYVNNTNRNDIVSTKVSNDGNNLYIQVETKDDIVIDKDMDNNLNILLSLPDSDLPAWEGYNFILNRSALNSGNSITKLERVKTNGEFDFEEVGEVNTYMDGNFFSVAIPLASLGIEKDNEFTVDLKVADGISDPSDIMNYYIDGDSAPIGRLNYRYNSKHK